MLSKVSRNTIHPFSILTYSTSGSQGPIPATIWARGRVTSWTGRQSITGPHRDKQQCTLAPRDGLESRINPTCMCLDAGRKLKYPERTHACTGRTCKLHKGRPPLGFEPETLLLWGDGDNHQGTLNVFTAIIKLEVPPMRKSYVHRKGKSFHSIFMCKCICGRNVECLILVS